MLLSYSEGLQYAHALRENGSYSECKNALIASTTLSFCQTSSVFSAEVQLLTNIELSKNNQILLCHKNYQLYNNSR